MLSGKTIGFLGGGNITESLIRGMTDRGVVEPAQLLVTNRANLGRLQALQARYGVRVTTSKAEVIEQAYIVVLAPKPKDAPALMAEVGHLFRPGQILLTVMAGISTAFLESAATPGVQVVRAMPNTSCEVGESATAIAMGACAGVEAALHAREIMGAVGVVVEVPEHHMDAVTGLSGSGPAFIYFMIEAMMEAGKSVGLPSTVARDLAIQTLKGAAKMLDETGEDPAILRQKITSPNGTTVAGLQALGEAGFSQAVIRAVTRATQRSREMGIAAATPNTAAG